MTEPDIYAEARALRAEQVTEWGQYVCGPAPIDINGARAANPDDPIPASLVDSGAILPEQVVRTAPALTEKV